MCDTIFADDTSTATGHCLFGKNSDRQRNEAQAVELCDAQAHPPGSTLNCTYISVPQVEHTFAALICRPFWMWGAEMGLNEHGVVIGNEGLYSSVAQPVDAALTGMDLLRLGLERSRTAEEAVRTITSLLAEHGQGGNCGHLAEAYYHNGYLIADAKEAYVLETVAREWVCERVRGVRAISNQYSIGSDFEELSPGMHAVLEGQGWDGISKPNVAKFLADPKLVHVGSAAGRKARATHLLEARLGDLSLTDVFAVLRDHDPTGALRHPWNPRDSLPYSLCIHAGGSDRISQTTCSLAVDLKPGQPVAWVTGTAAPCISVFKPVMIGTPLPSRGAKLTDHFDAGTLWWSHEQLHRRALSSGLERFLSEISDERDTLEREFQAIAESARDGGLEKELEQVIAMCWGRATSAETRWLQRLASDRLLCSSDYDTEWRLMNARAAIPGEPSL